MHANIMGITGYLKSPNRLGIRKSGFCFIRVDSGKVAGNLTFKFKVR